MIRAAGIFFLATLVTPALAAGDAFEGAPWWFVLAVCIPVVGIFFLLATGGGFLLQGFLRLRNALALMATLCVVFWALLLAGLGFEKALRGLPGFAMMLAIASPLFGLGWFVGTRNATRRSDRRARLNTGSNHG